MWLFVHLKTFDSKKKSCVLQSCRDQIGNHLNSMVLDVAKMNLNFQLGISEISQFAIKSKNWPFFPFCDGNLLILHAIREETLYTYLIVPNSIIPIFKIQNP